MSNPIVHAFVSAKSDGGDSSQVRPSDWNGGHLGFDTVKITGDETGKTDANLVNTGLSFSVKNGVTYHFKFVCIYRSSVATVGVKLAVTHGGASMFSARTFISGNVADGATTEPWAGNNTTSGDAVTSPTTIATVTDYIATVEGVIVPNTDGTLMLQYAAETTGATVTMKAGSCAYLMTM
jgi:hypothetical protein